VEELRFDGKTVIVTGGGRGFGRCHGLLFAERGARVVVADFGVELDGTGSSPEPAETVAAEIRAAGGEAVGVFADVSDPAGAAVVVQAAVDGFGSIDVLVNNAGISDPDWFEEQSEERLRRMTDHQYFSVLWMARAAWPHLQAAGGCMVNTASEAMLGNVPKAASYSGAKGGVFAFSRALALDGRRLGVRVNMVAPRGNTRMSAPEVLARHFDQPVEAFDNPFMAAMHPELVSPAVAYLAHPSCDLNGVTMVCGGGQAMLLACVETQGITITDRDLTPEDLAANIDAIQDMSGAILMGIDMFN
jgi:NAD(P)-dependent dehydrogenase (short-subunit alcohol dehydrogenase family)